MRASKSYRESFGGHQSLGLTLPLQGGIGPYKRNQHRTTPFGRRAGPSIASPFWGASHFTPNGFTQSGRCCGRYA